MLIEIRERERMLRIKEGLPRLSTMDISLVLNIKIRPSVSEQLTWSAWVAMGSAVRSSVCPGWGRVCGCAG